MDFEAQISKSLGKIAAALEEHNKISVALLKNSTKQGEISAELLQSVDSLDKTFGDWLNAENDEAAAELFKGVVAYDLAQTEPFWNENDRVLVTDSELSIYGREATVVKVEDSIHIRLAMEGQKYAVLLKPNQIIHVPDEYLVVSDQNHVRCGHVFLVARKFGCDYTMLTPDGLETFKSWQLTTQSAYDEMIRQLAEKVAISEEAKAAVDEPTHSPLTDELIGQITRASAPMETSVMPAWLVNDEPVTFPSVAGSEARVIDKEDEHYNQIGEIVRFEGERAIIKFGDEDAIYQSYQRRQLAHHFDSKEN